MTEERTFDERLVEYLEKIKILEEAEEVKK